METIAYTLSIAILIFSVFMASKSYSLKWTIIITLWNSAWYFVMLYVWEWHSFIVWTTIISVVIYGSMYLYLKYKKPVLFQAMKDINELINNNKII